MMMNHCMNIKYQIVHSPRYIWYTQFLVVFISIFKATIWHYSDVLHLLLNFYLLC